MAFKRYAFKTEDWILQLGKAVMNLKKKKKVGEKQLPADPGSDLAGQMPRHVRELAWKRDGTAGTST